MCSQLFIGYEEERKGGRACRRRRGKDYSLAAASIRFPNFHVGSLQAVRRADRNLVSLSLGPAAVPLDGQTGKKGEIERKSERKTV